MHAIGGLENDFRLSHKEREDALVPGHALGDVARRKMKGTVRKRKEKFEANGGGSRITAVRKLGSGNVERERNGHIVHGPGADVAGVPQWWTAHRIHTHRDEIHIRGGGEGKWIEIPKVWIRRRD